jgi:Rrf2 family protein
LESRFRRAFCLILPDSSCSTGNRTRSVLYWCTVMVLSKKVDYALVSLAHLVEHPDQFVSARQIAERDGLPLPLLMKILKSLNQHGILSSTRGVKGGYRITFDLDELSLGELIGIIEGSVALAVPVRKLSLQPPVQALQFKLVRFLQDVKVIDLVKPGRRIDVPLERLSRVAREFRTPMVTSV